MLIIDSWCGMFGNNILQIIRAIYYAKIHNHDVIHFPRHEFIDTTTIYIGGLNSARLVNSFFYLNQLGLQDPSPEEMKVIFQQHIRLVCNLTYFPKCESGILGIHVRGGDIFTQNPHPAYVQPPLSYYLKCMESYSRVDIISEDTRNPCIQYLCEDARVHFSMQCLRQDIEKLLTYEDISIGFGTFGFVIYLISENIKTVYIPKYVLNELPAGTWGDITLQTIDIPGYIPVGEWKNTQDQRVLMIDYKLTDSCQDRSGCNP